MEHLPLFYTDYLDDQLRLRGEPDSPANLEREAKRLWGYLCWHLIVHGGIVVSDSWWKNHAALGLLRQRGFLGPLVERGLLRVALREGRPDWEEAIGEDGRRTDPVRWSLAEVGSSFTAMVNRCLDESDAYLTLLLDERRTPAHEEALRELAAHGRRLAEERWQRPDDPAPGLLLRDEFYPWLRDPHGWARHRALLQGFLDQPYRINFQQHLARTHGCHALLVEENVDVAEWLNGLPPFLSRVNHKRTSADLAWTRWPDGPMARNAKWFLFMDGVELDGLAGIASDGQRLARLLEPCETRSAWLERRWVRAGLATEDRYLQDAERWFTEVFERMATLDAGVAALARREQEAAGATRVGVHLRDALGPALIGVATWLGSGDLDAAALGAAVGAGWSYLESRLGRDRAAELSERRTREQTRLIDHYAGVRDREIERIAERQRAASAAPDELEPEQDLRFVLGPNTREA